jgi:hypothetical protein
MRSSHIPKFLHRHHHYSCHNRLIPSDTNVPIVLRPLPGGICPQGYHLVSGTVCIKDLPSAAPTKIIPTPTIPATTNTTNAFSTPLSSTIQPNDTNPSNNEENFGTKILKSFNQEFK